MADEAQPGQEGGEQPPQPTEEELRAYEEQIGKLRIEDLVLQYAVSILNLTARRIAKEDERDLAQAKVGIDAARALTELVPEQAQAQLRQALSELQLLYAKHSGEEDGGEGAPPSGEQGGQPSGGEAGPAAGTEGGRRGGGDSPLWTPGS
jgi:hypothetical protein